MIIGCSPRAASCKKYFSCARADPHFLHGQVGDDERAEIVVVYDGPELVLENRAVCFALCACSCTSRGSEDCLIMSKSAAGKLLAIVLTFGGLYY